MPREKTIRIRFAIFKVSSLNTDNWTALNKKSHLDTIKSNPDIVCFKNIHFFPSTAAESAERSLNF